MLYGVCIGKSRSLAGKDSLLFLQPPKITAQFSGPLLRKQTEEHTKRCGHVGTTQQRFPFLDGVVSFELRTHIYRGAAVTGQCLPPVRMAASLHETNSIILTVSPMIISLLLSNVYMCSFGSIYIYIIYHIKYVYILYYIHIILICK